MKVFLHIPLFVIILVIYNLALIANRDSLQPETSPAPLPTPAAQAPATPEVAAPPTIPAPGSTEPSPALTPGAAAEPGSLAPAPAATPATPAATPGASSFPAPGHPLDKALFHVPLPSKAVMPVTINEFLLILAVILLYVELFKSTRTGNATIVEHVLSLLVFMAFFVELIVYGPAGTPTFLIMTLLSFLDVIAGFTITISTARRDFGVGAHTTEGA